MKKVKVISYISLILILGIFIIVYSRNTSKDDVNKEEGTMTLNISEFSNERIIAEDNTNIKYTILNSGINITDKSNNYLSWNDLKNVKTIEVHYVGEIKEISPAKFEKITKIVIIYH